MDLTVRAGWTLEETLAEAYRLDQGRQAMGFDQRALDKVAKQGLANGAFEETPEEGTAIAEEFYPPQGAEAMGSPGTPAVSLADKLAEKGHAHSEDASPAEPPAEPSASTG